jgi:hypothetical protein
LANRYTIRQEYGLVVTTFSGTVTREDFVALYRALYADPEYVPGLDEVADVMRVTMFDVHTAELQAARDLMVARYRQHPGASCRTAILASADVSFGIGRMYQALADETPEHVQVFRDPEQAARWLRPDVPGLLALLAAD